MTIKLDDSKVSVNQKTALRAIIATYSKPDLAISLWQITSTFILFSLTWYLMYLSLTYSWWLTLALSPLAAGFQLRLFIILHDCGHGAFFKTRLFNDIVGSLLGVICFTPYYHWRHSHAIHHATNGNLSRRAQSHILPTGFDKYRQTNGDILTLTVKEYSKLAPGEQRIYQLYRQLILWPVVVPLFIFVVLHRLVDAKADRRERYSVYWTNLAIFGLILGLSFTIGLVPLLLVELPIMAIASSVGVWLFYVQHQFEETYWQHSAAWDYTTAAVLGSSYYKLPAVLQWFTGNIGFHHIHHLNPRIPNYQLEKCHAASPLLQDIKPVTLLVSLKSISLKLWDEEQAKLVSFRDFKSNSTNE